METSTQVLIKLHYFSVSAAVIPKALILQRCGSPAEFFCVREKHTTENDPKMLRDFLRLAICLEGGIGCA